MGYNSKVKECIRETVLTYIIPVYNMDRVSQISPMDLQFTINDQLLFEMILLKIREMTLFYASQKKKMKDSREKFIIERLDSLSEKIEDSLADTEILRTEFQSLSDELETIRAEYMQGLLTRTRAKWIEEGEKPSRYFCSLEKRNYIEKNITKITTDSGEKN